MNTDIRYIFLDLGGTFRIVREDAAYSAAAKAEIARLCGVEGDPEAFFSGVIEPRYNIYREWALRYMCEAPEEILWTRWLAYDRPDQRMIWENAPALTYEYRKSKGERLVVEGGVETVKELHARGYTLGVISDLVGKREIDEWLDRDGLRPYFKTVQQSSVTYVRKPGPAIYYYAMEEAGARPEQCCYVGDNLNRDILGAKACAFGMTVAVQYNREKPLKLTPENRPDAKVYAFRDLLAIFPGCGRVNAGQLIAPEDGQ